MYRLNKSSGLLANQKQGYKFKIPLLVLLAVSLFCRAAEARTDIYTFLSDQSTVVQTGGFAGVHETYPIEGKFRLSVDFDAGIASFERVDANLLEPSGFLYTQDLGELFNMRELTGIVVDDTTINFEGKTADDTNTDIHIRLTFTDDSVYLIGETVPPPNSADFFIYNLDAAARKKFAGGTGEPNEPYRIATTEQLVSIGDDPNLLDRHYILINDIDLDPNLPGGRVFTHAVIAYETNEEVGFQGTTFKGGFDGNNHKIKNLTIDANSTGFLGLFGGIESNSLIRNLGLEDVVIIGSDSVGGLAGSSSGTITNCYVTGSITCGENSSFIGGLFGTNFGIIKDCRTSVVVTSGENSGRLGGLVGSCFQGSIINCYATGTVSAGDRSYYLGGLLGSSDWVSVIINCYSSGSVSGGDYSSCIGGLVGWDRRSYIDNCYAAADVTGGDGSDTLGGLVGLNEWWSTITDCYAMGSISGGLYLGGLVGNLRPGSALINCYATGRKYCGVEICNQGGLIGQNEYSDVVLISQCFWDIEATGASSSDGGTGLTTAQMQDIQTYRDAGWDLAGDRSDGTSDVWQIPEWGGYPKLVIFSEDYQPHILSGSGTQEDPYLIATALGLGAIRRYDKSACYKLVTDINLSGITWGAAPISRFNGSFDGNSHRISYLTINRDVANCLGLFGVIENNGMIENLGLEDVIISGAYESSSLGGLAGSNGGQITNCYVTGKISAGDESFNLGTLVGGNFGVITNCYAIGSVSSGDNTWSLGGLIGDNYEGTITNCYVAAEISIPVENEDIGGLVGWSTGGTNLSFWDVETSGMLGSAGGEGKTTAEMQTANTFLDAGWDFDDIWMICEGVDYPRLQWQNIQCGD